jgi:hypothetical protein
MEGGRRRGAQTAQQRPDHSAGAESEERLVFCGAKAGIESNVQANETGPGSMAVLLPEDQPNLLFSALALRTGPVGGACEMSCQMISRQYRDTRPTAPRITTRCLPRFFPAPNLLHSGSAPPLVQPPTTRHSTAHHHRSQQ